MNIPSSAPYCYIKVSTFKYEATVPLFPAALDNFLLLLINISNCRVFNFSIKVETTYMLFWGKPQTALKYRIVLHLVNCTLSTDIKSWLTCVKQVLILKICKSVFGFVRCNETHMVSGKLITVHEVQLVYKCLQDMLQDFALVL